MAKLIELSHHRAQRSLMDLQRKKNHAMELIAKASALLACMDEDEVKIGWMLDDCIDLLSRRACASSQAISVIS